MTMFRYFRLATGAAVHVGAPFMTPGWRRSPLAAMSRGDCGGGWRCPRCGGVYCGGGWRQLSCGVARRGAIYDARLAAFPVAAVCAGICGGGWRRFRCDGVAGVYWWLAAFPLRWCCGCLLAVGGVPVGGVCGGIAGGVPGDTSVAPTFGVFGGGWRQLPCGGARGDMKKERRRLLSGLPAFWCCAVRGSDEFDAAFEELVEGLAFEQSVLQEGDVDELVHHGLPGAVVGEHFGLLLFLGGDVLVAL